MFVRIVFRIIILITWPLYPLSSAQDEYSQSITAQPGCESSCGDITIFYPFGIAEKGTQCYADKWFEIECRYTNTTSGDDYWTEGYTPYLKSLSLEVTSIDVTLGTIDIRNPVFGRNCRGKRDARQVIHLEGSPFRYSQAQNKFLAYGCNKIAFLNSNGSKVSGCVPICDENKQVDDNSLQSDGCFGKYCCQTSLPKYLSEYNATFEDLSNNHGRNQCSYALIAKYVFSLDEEQYSGVSGSYYPYGIPSLEDLKENVTAVLEWEFFNATFPKRLKSSQYAKCYVTNVTSSHSGWRCDCGNGYTGNPYLADGCIVDLAYYSSGTNNGAYDRNGTNNRAKSAIIGWWHSICQRW